MLVHPLLLTLVTGLGGRSHLGTSPTNLLEGAIYRGGSRENNVMSLVSWGPGVGREGCRW